MKKIIGLAIAALIIMSTVGFGTWAYFNDVETSSGNQITAGTLDLTLDGGNSNVNILTGLSNKAPGDTGRLYATIKNVGNLSGEFEVQTGSVTNTGPAGSTEYELAHPTGVLGANCEIAPWIDLDEDDVFDAGSDLALKSDQTVTTTALQWDTVNNFGSKTWDVLMAAMTPNQQARFQISWRIPTGAGNEIQGDSFTIGFTFILEQADAD